MCASAKCRTGLIPTAKKGAITDSLQQAGDMSPQAYRQRYEQLRQQMLAGRGNSRAWGLNLLQTRGVAAWAKAACDEQTSGSPVIPPQLPVTNGVGLPERIQRQMATVLAEMILRRMPEFASSFH